MALSHLRSRWAATSGFTYEGLDPDGNLTTFDIAAPEPTPEEQSVLDLVAQLPRPRSVSPSARPLSVDLDAETVLWSDGMVTPIMPVQYAASSSVERQVRSAIWFHGTSSPKPFGGWRHYGTEQAARDRINPDKWDLDEFPSVAGPNVVQAFVVAPGARICPDVGEDEEFTDLTPQPERWKERHPDVVAWAFEYDVYAYRNEYEDAGSLSIFAKESVMLPVGSFGRGSPRSWPRLAEHDPRFASAAITYEVEDYGHTVAVRAHDREARMRAGWIGATVSSNYDGITGVEPVYVVDMLDVHPDYQRRGVATELWNRCSALVEAKGSRLVHGWDLSPDAKRWIKSLPSPQYGMPKSQYKPLQQLAGLEVNEFIWVWDVDWSDNKDDLMAGNIVSGTSRVEVAALTENESRLLAETMVMTVAGREPTGARLVTFWLPDLDENGFARHGARGGKVYRGVCLGQIVIEAEVPEIVEHPSPFVIHGAERCVLGPAKGAPAADTSSVQGPITSPLDYHGRRPQRLYITDPSFEGDPGHSYFTESGTVAFLDFTDQGRWGTFIDYVSVYPGQRRKGLARKLVQRLYDLTAGRSGTEADMDWGEIMDHGAAVVYREFEAKYPERHHRCKGIGYYE